MPARPQPLDDRPLQGRPLREGVEVDLAPTREGEEERVLVPGHGVTVQVPPPLEPGHVGGRVERLRQNGTLFLATAKKLGLDTGFSLGLAVVPIIVGDSLKAVTLSDRLFRRGINVQPIIHPAVPERASRLRFFLTSEQTPDQIRDTVNAVAEELAAIDKGGSLIEQHLAKRA